VEAVTGFGDAGETKGPRDAYSLHPKHQSAGLGGDYQRGDSGSRDVFYDADGQQSEGHREAASSRILKICWMGGGRYHGTCCHRNVSYFRVAAIFSVAMPNNLLSEKPPELGRLIQVAYLVVILSAFAWAKELLLPLILAILISFLLAPVVSRLERWRFPRAVAVLSVVAIGFALIGGLCSTLSLEGLDLVNSLPKYRDNIHTRWVAIQHGPPGPLSLAVSNVNGLITDLGKVTASSGVQQPEVTKVQIISGADNVFAILKNSLTPVAAPIGEFAVVVVLVVFMLLERNRLRVRFLRLIGHSRVATTNLAVDEVGSKLSRFLLGQLLVNTGYALLLGLGLFLIGIPNALLWAVLTLILRFLPYVGLWISAFFPLLLSIAISTSWKEPILTLALYGGLEVFTNNVVEPFVLGHSTGMSALAIIVSALFWTWLWGSDRFIARDTAHCLPGSVRSLFSGIQHL
jgi:predicted PurR-regulated permease PerM